VKRRLFNILAAILLFAVIVMWHRNSFFGRGVGEMLGWWAYEDDGQQIVVNQIGLFSCRGGLGLGKRWIIIPSSEGPPTYSDPDDTGFGLGIYMGDGDDYPFGFRAAHWWEAFGFVFRTPSDPRNYMSYGESGITLPCWFLVVLLILFLAPSMLSQIAQRVQKRRRLHGLCLTCNYNLTGNVSGVCPECGTAVPPRPRLAAGASE